MIGRDEGLSFLHRSRNANTKDDGREAGHGTEDGSEVKRSGVELGV